MGLSNMNMPGGAGMPGTQGTMGLPPPQSIGGGGIGQMGSGRGGAGKGDGTPFLSALFGPSAESLPISRMMQNPLLGKK
jgi:hypothetical protein